MVIMGQMRLDKFLCDRTGCTRKEAKLYIKNGQVLVDDERMKRPEYKIDEEKSCVFLNGKKIKGDTLVYIMLHKPKGVVSATKDYRDETVIDLVSHMTHKDIFPVGRLDKDTTGLLLLTNDGEMSHELLSPKKHVDKVYEVIASGKITTEEQRQFEQGLDIGEKNLTKPAILDIVEAADTESKVLVTIREGKFHQIKRMFHKVGMDVLELKRISMGPLLLDDSLQEGEARFLTKEEIKQLKELYVRE
ncbi:MAG: pseudouridine synthase [Anaerostipes sp.]|nr:pseudouridine synthase [Anaerostipes sp.]